MEITLTTGVLMYTLDDGSTGYINLTNDILIDILNGTKYLFGGAVNSPNALEGNQPAQVPYYIVRLPLVNKTWFDIRMGEITNQTDWTDDLTGANTCASDISANFA